MIYQYHAINIKSRDDLRDIGPGKYNYYSIYCIYPASYENLANVAKSFPWGIQGPTDVKLSHEIPTG